MTEILYSFEPNTSDLHFYMILGIISFLVCAALFYYSLKKNKQLLLMFSGFIGCIALGVAIFSKINQNKLPKVQLYENGLVTPQGKVNFDDIRKIEMKEIEEHSKFPIQKGGKMIAIDTVKLILIEEYSGKAHVLAKANYPVDEIFGKLSILVENYREKNEKEEE